jgi:hypothetical protein
VNWELDHLVVAARRLDDGVAWCEATLGITPTAGGTHPLMGTHNRVFAIGSPRFPRAYFEIIAIDPAAPVPARTRWFDLDDASLQGALGRGPALVHWVARCGDVRTACAHLKADGIDRGTVLAAERNTPGGLLRWQISVRVDGRRLWGGALPTLIGWGAVHPTDTLPDSGVKLARFELGGLPDSVLKHLPADIEIRGAAEGSLHATLATPRGRVVIESIGLGSRREACGHEP